MAALCSPRPERDVWFVGVNVNVWGTPDDIEVDMGTALICECVVLVLGVIPAVIRVCVMAGNHVSVTLSSMILGGMDKVLPEVIFVGVLLVDVKAVIPANPLCDWLLVPAAVALFGSVDVDTVHPISLLLGESEVTMSANVEGSVSKDPSAIIAAIAGTGVDVMVSL
jgi:hypothetical protein